MGFANQWFFISPFPWGKGDIEFKSYLELSLYQFWSTLFFIVMILMTWMIYKKKKKKKKEKAIWNMIELIIMADFSFVYAKIPFVKCASISSRCQRQFWNSCIITLSFKWFYKTTLSKLSWKKGKLDFNYNLMKLLSHVIYPPPISCHYHLYWKVHSLM